MEVAAEERLTREMEDACEVDVETLRQLAAEMAARMEEGLRSEENVNLKMLPSFLHSLPHRGVTGTYYALDVGGTNFRILRVSLGDARSSLEVIPQDLKTGTAEVVLRTYPFRSSSSSAKEATSIVTRILIETKDVGEDLQEGTSEVVLRTDPVRPSSSFVYEATSTIRILIKTKDISEELKRGKREAFFEFLASSIETFLKEEENGADSASTKEKRQLGFTFSFPVQQTSVSSGSLIRWTKGFTIEDMEGEEVAGLLQQALDKKKINMKVAALVNDTVGSLALAHYNDQNTVAAVIIGTGTNAAYVEKTVNITKLSPEIAQSSEQMVINTEWGNFSSEHLRRTSYDEELDQASLNRDENLYEKMISGMYLGEIVRRVILKISQESSEFRHATDMLSHRPFALKTHYITKMQEDKSLELNEVEGILREQFGIQEVSLSMRRIIVRVCDAVIRRAARLAAAGIAGILKKTGREDGERKTVVSIEGGLYANSEKFKQHLQEGLTEILGECVAENVDLKQTDDGSGLGAALLAAAASHSSSS